MFGPDQFVRPVKYLKVRLERAQVSHSSDRLFALPSNNRLVFKNRPGENTLAYFYSRLKTAIKGFVALATDERERTPG